MKRYLLSIILVLFCTSAWANPSGFVGAIASGGGAAPARTYLLDQGFEGTGYETGAGDDGTWATVLGTPNPDYTTNPGDGDQSLFLGGCAGAATDVTASVSYTALSSGRLYVKRLFKVSANGGGSSGSDTLMTFFNNTTALSTIYLTYVSPTTYTVRVQAFGDATAENTSGTVTVGNWYTLCASYQPGGGTDAYSDVSFSIDGTCPTSGSNFASSTEGTRTQYSNKMVFAGEYTSGTDCFDSVWDKVQDDDVSF